MTWLIHNMTQKMKKWENVWMVIDCNAHIFHLCYIHDPVGGWGDRTSATEPPRAPTRPLNSCIITQLITTHFTLSCMWHRHFVFRPPIPQSRRRTIEQTFCWGLNLSHVSSFWVISSRTHTSAWVVLSNSFGTFDPTEVHLNSEYRTRWSREKSARLRGKDGAPKD